MFEFLKILTKRPSDKTIRLTKIAFGIIIITAGYYNLIYQGDPLVETLFGKAIDESTAIYIKYAILWLGIFPIITGATDLYIFKAKYTRILQIFTAILLFYAAGIIKDSASLEYDTLIGIMALLPLLSGITGKGITKKGLKYGEKITKIRV